jgi:hypothetical protein
MNHINDEQLILILQGDVSSLRETREHLMACADCRKKLDLILLCEERFLTDQIARDETEPILPDKVWKNMVAEVFPRMIMDRNAPTAFKKGTG